MKKNRIKLILVEPYQDRRVAEKVARASDASVIDSTQFPGGLPGTDNYVSLINQLVKQLAEGMK
jgi:ABC-type Zn uptake system ZnuABC Zn-binding protein ZnuA